MATAGATGTSASRDFTFRRCSLAEDSDSVALNVRYAKPVQAEATLLMSIERQGILVEAMLRSQATYVQASTNGEAKMDPGSPMLLMHLADAGFSEDWDHLLHKRMEKVLSNKGLTRGEAKRSAKGMIADMRELVASRW